MGDEPPFALPDGADAGGVVLADRLAFWRQAVTVVRLYDRFDEAQDSEDLGAMFAVLRDMGAAGVHPPALPAGQVEVLGKRDRNKELPILRTAEPPGSAG